MRVKITYPAPGFESRVGHVVEVTPQEGKRLIEKDWCFEVEDEQPKVKKVKNEPKPTEEL